MHSKLISIAIITLVGVASAHPRSLVSRQIKISPDNTCGVQADGTNVGFSCDNSTTAGPCCSQYGFCGTGSGKLDCSCQTGLLLTSIKTTVTPIRNAPLVLAVLLEEEVVEALHSLLMVVVDQTLVA